MSTVISLSNESKNAQADSLTALLSSGCVKVYDGTPPADANTALSSNTLLATLPWGVTAAPAAVDGLITFNLPVDDTSIDATGTATFYRTLKTDETSVVTQGSVGVSGESMTISDPDLTLGDTLSITSFLHQV